MECPSDFFCLNCNKKVIKLIEALVKSNYIGKSYIRDQNYRGEMFKKVKGKL